MATKDHPTKQAYKKSDANENRLANENAGRDLRDSPRDREELQSEPTILNLPDVDDIAGQSHVRVPPLGELADTTVSSEDEEGADLLQDEEDDAQDITNSDADVSGEERDLLEKADTMMPDSEEYNLRAASLDDRDNDGEPLNEASFGDDMSGKDLDVPGSDDDDPEEELGEEDEENNEYSLASNDDNAEESEETT